MMGTANAIVEQTGRWTYRVYVEIQPESDELALPMTWGLNGYGWLVLGKKRAHRKARRVLARYLRQQRYTGSTVIVSAVEPDAEADRR